MNSSLARKATITYADFLLICHVHDPTEFCGFKVDPSGLYVAMPDIKALLTYEERSVLSWHPTGHYSDPVLSLPCTLDELQTFVACAGLIGCIDTEVLAEVLASKIEPETPAQRGARLLAWHDAETLQQKRGAVQRVFNRELVLNPNADRSAVGKAIKRAQAERDEEKGVGAGMFSQLVIDGKRQC